jgi:hypothetical protein
VLPVNRVPFTKPLILPAAIGCEGGIIGTMFFVDSFFEQEARIATKAKPVTNKESLIVFILIDFVF